MSARLLSAVPSWARLSSALPWSVARSWAEPSWAVLSWAARSWAAPWSVAPSSARPLTAARSRRSWSR
ncbi:MAG TPA: hypothetical protein VFE26_12255 [Trebonia sp.]|nr:hypothetical protein [Trebonia sp.]